jgi:coenzyme PQQ precursor peptide PqqA
MTYGPRRAGTERALRSTLLRIREGVKDKMDWTTPEFVEVKMDAEINSYADDFSGI